MKSFKKLYALKLDFGGLSTRLTLSIFNYDLTYLTLFEENITLSRSLLLVTRSIFHIYLKCLGKTVLIWSWYLLQTYNASADSVLGRIEAEAEKDEEMAAAPTEEVKKDKKKKKKAVADEKAAEEDVGKKKDKKKKKHAAEEAVEVQNEEENVDKKKKKRKHVEVDEAEPEAEKSNKKKDKKKKKKTEE